MQSLTRSVFVVTCLASVFTGHAGGESPVYSEIRLGDALTEDQWHGVDKSIDRGLQFLAAQQRPDGSFPSHLGGQPGVTSLVVMAFVSRGHHPGQGRYGDVLLKAIDYVVDCQEPSGLIAADHQQYRKLVFEQRPHTATYNHAVSGLMLGEVYGHGGGELDDRLLPTIKKALTWARMMQQRPPRYPADVGGWRYLHPGDGGKPRSDLSATGWFAMFYRSARNAEFAVPEANVLAAADFAERCFDHRSGGFFYGPTPSDQMVTRGMTGAGLLVLTIAGRRDEVIARRAGDWLLAHPFEEYGQRVGGHDRFHYGAYYCSQAMYLLGGDYWARFYPVLARTFVQGQLADGGWPPESRYNDARFGRCYSTALAVLALTPPYQMLPIYQR